jgi:hypothetical protein
MKHPIVPFVFLATVCGVLIWNAGEDEQPPVRSSSTTLAALALPAESPPPTPSTPSAPTALVVTDTWAHPEVMHELRSVKREDPVAVRAAIARAHPVLGTDQDVQLQVGDLLTSVGDPVDGLAWLLLACMDCTQVDERIGYGCAAEGLCDPHLAYVDVLRRDLGEAMVADALARMEEIQAAIAAGDSLAPFTEILDARFPKDVGECVQLRTPTEECPPEEIIRQTREAWDQTP